ncbi:hypothetical protein [Klebsiella oxytoca]|uniref:hypothetical protein n=1 Tax=Klebsiella oxytoca TaxID=571 RepID=UPI001A22DECC|nr:hypothetical protein [Klebsiella oxytoca]HAT2770281.1 hypothetical protein [Klebsiella oxytoca]
MTDITELAQSEINDALAQLKQLSEYPTPSTQYARVLHKYFSSLVEALEKAQSANNSAPAILRQLAEEKQKRGEVAAATAFNYAASALQKELSK